MWEVMKIDSEKEDKARKLILAIEELGFKSKS
jgi:hypothetical protein